MWEALPNSSVLGSCSQGCLWLPRKPGLREQGTKQRPAFRVPAPFLAAARVWRKPKWDQPDKDETREADRRPASAPGSTQRPPRARCRLQLGHDPRFSRRTIGRGAGAGGCVAGRAGSLSGELRSTSRGSPFRAQAPFASPIPPSIFFLENGAGLSVALRPTNSPPPNKETLFPSERKG